MTVSKTADWTILELDPEMLVVVEQCARRSARRFGSLVADWDDLYQEALIILSTRAEDYRSSYSTGGMGGVQYRLLQDLADFIEPRVNKVSRNVSLDILLDQADPGLE